MSRARHFSLNSNEKIFSESTLFLGVPRGIFPERMSSVIEKLVPQQPIDACCLRDCMSRARHFSLNSNEKTFSESTLFLGVPRGMFPERMSPALAELVPQHQFDAHGPSNCISLMCFFSLNSNEKTFSESTLFPGLPSCVLPERLLSCSLGGIVFALQHKCVPLIE